jgi:hypothetical protein
MKRQYLWAILPVAVMAFQSARAQPTPGAETSPRPQAPSGASTPDSGSGVQPPPVGAAPGGRGVLHPPGGVDPGMTKPPPNPQAYPMPVVPPPGSPGGNTTVVPK